MSTQSTAIGIQTTINAPLAKVWECFTQPEHVKQWNNASPDWHTPAATNDLSVGGRFVYRMEAKDGSFGFDFGGTYTSVQPNTYLAYTLDDDRKVEVEFKGDGSTTHITEHFEPESENPVDFQKMGWQAILDNFKAYTEKQ